jgi:hypothetical protein
MSGMRSFMKTWYRAEVNDMNLNVLLRNIDRVLTFGTPTFSLGITNRRSRCSSMRRSGILRFPIISSSRMRLDKRKCVWIFCFVIDLFTNALRSIDIE